MVLVVKCIYVLYVVFTFQDLDSAIALDGFPDNPSRSRNLHLVTLRGAGVSQKGNRRDSSVTGKHHFKSQDPIMV